MTADIGARWTARQLAMLQAMGIDFGARPRDADAPVAPATPAAPATTTATPIGAATATTAAAPHPPRPRSGPATAAAEEAWSATDRIARGMTDFATATAAAAPAGGAERAVEGIAAPAHWLVVSEPLPAGSPPAKLLAAMLRAVGLPPTSWAAPDTPRARRAALAVFEPGADLASDRARLMDAVQQAAPRCIVVFGRAPARALLSTELPLAELRGRVHRLGETPVVVSYAVPYLLRQPADKARAWEDLCLATRACEATG